LAVGFGLAALLVALDAIHGGGVGSAIAGAVGAVLGSPPIQQLLNNNTFGLYTVISTYVSQCAHVLGACRDVQQLGHNPNLIVPYLLTFYVKPGNLATAAAALVVLALGIEIGDWLVAAPSPYTFRGASAEAASTRSIFVLAFLSLLLAILGVVLFGTELRSQTIPFNQPNSLPRAGLFYVLAVGLSELGWFLGLGNGFLDALRERRWGWVVGLLVGALLVLVAAPFYAVAVDGVALVGCLVVGIDAVRHRRWGWAISILIVALVLGVALGDLLHPHTYLTFGFLVVMAPLVVYGLWAGPVQLQPRPEGGDTLRAMA
jgi:hypothetical protein